MSKRSTLVAIPHRKSDGRIFFENDPVEVGHDCSARLQGRAGKWKHLNRGHRGYYKHPVHGDNRFALVELHAPLGGEDSIELLEIELKHITHVPA